MQKCGHSVRKPQGIVPGAGDNVGRALSPHHLEGRGGEEAILNLDSGEDHLGRAAWNNL